MGQRSPPEHSLPVDLSQATLLLGPEKQLETLIVHVTSPKMSALPYYACHDTSSKITQRPLQGSNYCLSLRWHPQRNGTPHQTAGANARELL